jgi:hypothetical protein
MFRVENRFQLPTCQRMLKKKGIRLSLEGGGSPQDRKMPWKRTEERSRRGCVAVHVALKVVQSTCNAEMFHHGHPITIQLNSRHLLGVCERRNKGVKINNRGY